MRKIIILLVITFSFLGNYQVGYATEKIDQQYPIGVPGRQLTYKSKVKELPGSVVRKFELSLGTVVEKDGTNYQWLRLKAVKENGQTYNVYFLTSDYPSEILKTAEQNMIRYIVQNGDDNTLEFVDESDGSVILPNTGAWKHLLPRAAMVNNPFNYKVKAIMVRSILSLTSFLYKYR